MHSMDSPRIQWIMYINGQIKNNSYTLQRGKFLYLGCSWAQRMALGPHLVHQAEAAFLGLRFGVKSDHCSQIFLFVHSFISVFQHTYWFLMFSLVLIINIFIFYNTYCQWQLWLKSIWPYRQASSKEGGDLSLLLSMQLDKIVILLAGKNPYASSCQDLGETD